MSGFRLLPLIALLLAGCGHTGPQTVTRRRIDCNHYGMPAYVKDRIDVRPPKAHRVATYRWAHVSGPSMPLGAGRPMVVGYASPGSTESCPLPATNEPLDPPVPAPQILGDDTSPGAPTDSFRRDASNDGDHAPMPSARRERVRTSWLFRDLE